jgi:hypothetical protein
MGWGTTPARRRDGEPYRRNGVATATCGVPLASGIPRSETFERLNRVLFLHKTLSGYLKRHGLKRKSRIAPLDELYELYTARFV